MAELYLERDAGKEHLFWCKDEWLDKSLHGFKGFHDGTEYKLKPETLDEFISYIDAVGVGQWEDDMRAVAKWAWANPESKE